MLKVDFANILPMPSLIHVLNVSRHARKTKVKRLIGIMREIYSHSRNSRENLAKFLKMDFANILPMPSLVHLLNFSKDSRETKIKSSPLKSCVKLIRNSRENLVNFLKMEFANILPIL